MRGKPEALDEVCGEGLIFKLGIIDGMGLPIGIYREFLVCEILKYMIFIGLLVSKYLCIKTGF